MAVNALMTGMIVFRIFKVTGAMPSTSVEQTLCSTGGNKVRQIVFIIIESGMALLVIQVVRLVLVFMPKTTVQWVGASNFVIAINQVLNVIVIRIVFSISFVLLITFTWLGHRTNDNFCADSNEDVLR